MNSIRSWFYSNGLTIIRARSGYFFHVATNFVATFFRRWRSFSPDWTTRIEEKLRKLSLFFSFPTSRPGEKRNLDFKRHERKNETTRKKTLSVTFTGCCKSSDFLQPFYWRVSRARGAKNFLRPAECRTSFIFFSQSEFFRFIFFFLRTPSVKTKSSYPFYDGDRIFFH